MPSYQRLMGELAIRNSAPIDDVRGNWSTMTPRSISSKKRVVDSGGRFFEGGGDFRVISRELELEVKNIS